MVSDVKYGEFVVEPVVEQLTERQELIHKLIKASDVVGVVETQMAAGQCILKIICKTNNMTTRHIPILHYELMPGGVAIGFPRFGKERVDSLIERISWEQVGYKLG